MFPTLAQNSLRSFIIAVVAVALIGSAWAAPKFRIIHTFTGGNDGSQPIGQLALDSAGNLYGTSVEGGSTTACIGDFGCGTVFRLTPASGRWSETVLANFADQGYRVAAFGPVVLDSVGNIYGTGIGASTINGQSSFGEIFQLVNNGGTYTDSPLHFFFGGTTDGQTPSPGLVRDGAGNLYGSSPAGGALNEGVIFEFSPNGDGTWTETFPYTFGSGKSNAPVGTMAIDNVGNLYGTTAHGGSYGYGSVYKLSQVNGVWSIESLYDFTPTLNYLPSPGGLVMDSAGNLYGNTQYGGSYNVGSIYKLRPTAGYWTYSLIHSFTGSTDGGYPYGTVDIDSSGNLYGTAISGGIFQYGTVYKFTHSSAGRWTETLLHSFTNGADGSLPLGVTLDSVGNVYGVAAAGGTSMDGIAYEIIP